MVTQGTNLVNSADFVSALNATATAQTNTENGLNFKDMLHKSTVSAYSKQDSNTIGVKDSKSVQKDGKSVFEASKKTDAAKAQLQSGNKTSKVSKQDSAKVQEGPEEKVASELVKGIKRLIQKMLGISEEELSNIMETLGLTSVDLLQQSGLHQIMVESTGCEDAFDLLSNEELTTTFQQLLNKVEEMINQTGMTVEDLKSILETDDFGQLLSNERIDNEEVISSDHSEESEKAAVNEKDTKAPEVMSNEEDETQDSTEKKINFSVERSNTDEKSGNSDSTRQDDFHNEDAKATVDQLIDHIAVSQATTETDFSGELSTITTIRDIANQIVEEIKVVIRPGQTSMEMQLNPEHLGKVALTVSSKDGVMTAQFTAQTELAKEAIESQMQTLRQNLENQGIKVESIEVNVSNFSFEQSAGTNEREESGSRKSKRAFRMETEEKVDNVSQSSVLASGLVDENISNVDYSA